MDDNVINPGTPAATPAANPEATPATPATPETNPTTPTGNGVDLSAYMGEDGHTLDFNKVVELYNSAEKAKKTAAFFQTKYQQKNGVPDDISEYSKSFKPDSSYEKFMKEEGIPETFEDFYKFAKENGIGKDQANATMDWIMKALVSNGTFDNRSEAEKEAEFAKAKEDFSEKIKPLLESTHRTQEEQNEIITNFLKSDNIFTANPEMKEFITNMALTNPMGYMFVSMVTEMIDGTNVPVVSGTVSSKDLSAMRAELAKEQDPVRREQMMQQFFGTK